MAVQLTNDEASMSKMSCVRLGYFADDFVHHFVTVGARRSGGGGKRYPPLINRGYYARVFAVRRMMDAFLSTPLPGDGDDDAVGDGGDEKKRQVVSIGAGFDTTFFRLRKEGRAPARYLEVDYREVMHKKAGVINAVEELRVLCEGGVGVAPLTNGKERADGATAALDDEDAFTSPSEAAAAAATVIGDAGGYRLVSADLRDIPNLDAALASAGYDPGLPTLFLSECCLVYMEPEVRSGMNGSFSCFGLVR